MSTSSHKQQLLNALYEPFRGCTGCHFKMPKATRIVWGDGTPDSSIIFIGEAPGKDEDIQGKPFVGRSGKLLNRILSSLESAREKVFITNIVKCRPPKNRRPLPQEIEISRPLLYEQIKIIQPKVICTLGSSALEAFIGKQVKITQTRGKPFAWHGIIVLPTYHPAYILRNPKELDTLSADIKQALSLSL